MPEAAAQLIADSAKSQDPIVLGLTFVLAVVVILVAIAKPIMGLVRDYKTTGADAARINAETTMLDELRKQIEINSKKIEQLEGQKNVWFEKAVLLEREVDKLKVFEKTVESMKIRLDEKDLLISERDSEIRRLTRTILEMKDQIHNLELRLQRDELRILNCEDCPKKESARATKQAKMDRV